MILLPALAAAALLVPAADVDPASGKIPGYTYGADAFNSYTAWSGGMPWIWQFSSQHIGYPGNATAGQPFYLHAHTAVIAPHSVTGNVLLVIDQDAGGLPLRFDPSRPTICTRGQFDPVQATTSIACTTVRAESGQWVVSNLEPVVPGFGIDVQVPFVVDKATSGTAAMTAMWATTDVSLSNRNVLATVPVTVSSPITRPVPKKLRKYKKVKSLTPAVCTVSKRTVVKVSGGTCALKGSKWKGHKPRVVRFAW
jgi:hypothetical protein